MVIVMYLTGSIFYMKNTSFALHLPQMLTENVGFTNISVVRGQMFEGIRRETRGKPIYLYATNTQDEPSLKIPKILHFVWISRPIPTKYIAAIDKFKNDNKDYKIMLWCDSNSYHLLQNKNWTLIDVERFPLSIRDILATEDRPEDIGARSDLLRYEAVYQFGGIYMDTDSHSVKSLIPVFSHSFVSYALDEWNLLVNGVFGMPKGSKFLSFVLESARMNSKQKGYKNNTLYLRYGPTFLTSMFVHYNREEIHMIHMDYLCWKTSKSFTYQTNDGSWIDLG